MGKKKKSSLSDKEKGEQIKINKSKGAHADETSAIKTLPNTETQPKENEATHEIDKNHVSQNKSPKSKVNSEENKSVELEFIVKSKKKNKKLRNRDNIGDKKSLENSVTVEKTADVSDLPKEEVINKNKKKARKRKHNEPTEPKKSGLSQEDDVDNEEINKFCDELTEEDNVQYNDWIALIEAKLNSNTKKSK